MNPFYYSRKFFTKKQVKKIVLALILSFSWHLLGFDTVVTTTKTAQAAENTPETQIVSETVINLVPSSTEAVQIKTKEEFIPKKTINKVVKSTQIREVSAYNAGDIYQTDDSPCIAANGEDICKTLEMGYKRCAANFVPFGTILRIEGYGDCMVVDRMNRRYPNNVDIAMKYSEKKQALAWGRRKLNVSIITVQENELEVAVK